MVAKSCRRCGCVCRGSICDECRFADSVKRERTRPSRQERGYDSVYDVNRKIIVETQKVSRAPCFLCGNSFVAGQTVSAEHIISLRNGGTSALENLAPAHTFCNSAWNRRASLLFRWWRNTPDSRARKCLARMFERLRPGDRECLPLIFRMVTLYLPPMHKYAG